MGDQVLYCLAVDDEPLALKVLENYISSSKDLKLVAKCETVEEAFKALSTEHVDTIFLDLNLKDSFGLELVNRMSVETKGRYYIIITSALQPKTDDFRKIFKSDRIILVDFLTKPFSYERFVEVVRKTLDQKSRFDNDNRQLFS
jgi:two-component system, LytTR family, response regulator LytT